MPYKIHFVGLVCFIDNGSSSYLVALPDVRKVKNACAGGATIDEHRPYLIVRFGDIISSGSVTGQILNKCFIVDLSNPHIATLNFQYANTAGTMDESDIQSRGYKWGDIDPGFVIDRAAPKNVIVSTTIKQGLISMFTLPKTRAVITEVTVLHPGSFLIQGDGKELFKLSNMAEIVVANVSPKWIVDATYPDDDHFPAYYTLGTVSAPTCKDPVDNSTIVGSSSQHPYVSGGRGLRISCSTTIYP